MSIINTTHRHRHPTKIIETETTEETETKSLIKIPTSLRRRPTKI
jgi:hypothetical protein